MNEENEWTIQTFKKQEQEIAENLKIAESEKNIDKQIKYLLALGDTHIEKGNTKLKSYERGQYTRAMALYYSALNRATISEQKKLILEKIAFAEQSFLKSINIESKITSTDEIDGYKKILFDLRGWCKEEITLIDERYDITKIEDEKEKQPIENKRAEHVRVIQEAIQKTIKTLLTDMIAAAIDQIGEPPCKYTIIGFGSFAECRMTPYSDLEFGILVEEEPEEKLDYFRDLTELTHLKVIHLGETVLRPMKIDSLTDSYYDHSSKNGLKFDSFRYGGCKTPLGSRKEDGTIEFELIHTPQKMAKFQELGDKEWEKQHLPIGLFSPEYIMGNEKLLDDYQKKVKEMLSAGDEKPHIQRSLKTLKENMDSFFIELDSQYEEGKCYNIKEEIYRLSDRIVSALCLYFEIYDASGWEKIEKLKFKIGQGNTEHLKIIFSLASEVRLRAYLSAEQQMEKWFFNEIAELFSGNKKADIFFRYYYRALPFQDSIQDFLYIKKDYKFASIFFKNDFFLQSLINGRLLIFNEALDCVLKYLEKNSEDENALHRAGFFYNRLEKFNESKEYNEKSLKIREEKYGKDSLRLANTLNNLGQNFANLGQQNEAIKIYERVLIIDEKNDEKKLLSAITLINLGQQFLYLGKTDKAIKCYKKALDIAEKNHGDKHPSVACALTNLGNAYLKDNTVKKTAIYLYQKSLDIHRNQYGDVSPQVATDLNSIGCALMMLGQVNEACQHIENAININKKIHGYKHHAVLANLTNLAKIYETLGDIDKALRYGEEALTMGQKLYNDNQHRLLAPVLNNLGLAKMKLGNYKQAIKLFEQALSIDIKNYGDNHPNIAIRYNNLGLAYEKLGYLEKAISFHEKALNIHCNNETNDAAINFNNLGFCFEKQGNREKSIFYYQKAFNIFIKLYDDMHPKVIDCLKNLGSDYKKNVTIQNFDQIIQKGDIMSKKEIENKNNIVHVEHPQKNNFFISSFLGGSNYSLDKPVINQSLLFLNDLTSLNFKAYANNQEKHVIDAVLPNLSVDEFNLIQKQLKDTRIIYQMSISSFKNNRFTLIVLDINGEQNGKAIGKAYQKSVKKTSIKTIKY